MQIYVVRQNDSVDRIASQYQVAVSDIIYINQLTYPYALAIGQSLLIPTEQVREKSQVISNGYAYPFIDPKVLTETLHYLSELSVFSYGFTPQGDLLPPELDDTWMIQEAQKYGTIAIMTLTPFGVDGKFNNYLISSLVNNTDAKQHLIDELMDTITEKGFLGVDVDFEYIFPEDRDAFTVFVKELTEQMNAVDIQVSVALAPKTASNQPGLLYEGKDYGGLGAAANHVLLMTYEWGYTYGPPMAVAPIYKVREVVEYAITQIPRKKISLGIPNYGYDWALPYERGVTKARTIGNIEAVQIAVSYGVPILFDELAMSPYFHYVTEGIEHEVWFEDVRSIEAKFNLVKEFTLRGMGYWQIMKLFRSNLILLADTFYILKNK